MYSLWYKNQIWEQSFSEPFSILSYSIPVVLVRLSKYCHLKKKKNRCLRQEEQNVLFFFSKKLHILGQENSVGSINIFMPSPKAAFMVPLHWSHLWTPWGPFELHIYHLLFSQALPFPSDSSNGLYASSLGTKTPSWPQLASPGTQTPSGPSWSLAVFGTVDGPPRPAPCVCDFVPQGTVLLGRTHPTCGHLSSRICSPGRQPGSGCSLAQGAAHNERLYVRRLPYIAPALSELQIIFAEERKIFSKIM